MAERWVWLGRGGGRSLTEALSCGRRLSLLSIELSMALPLGRNWRMAWRPKAGASDDLRKLGQYGTHHQRLPATTNDEPQAVDALVALVGKLALALKGELAPLKAQP